jgi:hypothetical protein
MSGATMSVVVEHIDGYPRTEDVVVPLRRIVRMLDFQE